MSFQKTILEWNGTDDSLIGKLNLKDIPFYDTTFYTSRQLVSVLGPDAYRLVSATLSAAAAADPLVADMFLTIRTTGISFADPLTQAMIDQLAQAGNWPDSVVNAMKQIGVKLKSLAEIELGRDATLDDVKAIRLADWKGQMQQKANVLAARFADQARLAATEWTDQQQADNLLQIWQSL